MNEPSIVVSPIHSGGDTLVSDTQHGATAEYAAAKAQQAAMMPGGIDVGRYAPFESVHPIRTAVDRLKERAFRWFTPVVLPGNQGGMPTAKIGAQSRISDGQIAAIAANQRWRAERYDDSLNEASSHERLYKREGNRQLILLSGGLVTLGAFLFLTNA